MATLKEIAERSGFSLSTVSIVLRGDGEARGISPKTQEKIFNLAKEMDYTPDVFARRLRTSGAKARPLIALFWSDDFNSQMMARFLDTIRKEILEADLECEVLLYPYRTGNIQEVLNQESISMFNAIIMCSASPKDICYLEELSIIIPIVFYNRKSKKYPWVCMDEEAIGKQAADIFIRKGFNRVALITSQTFLQELPVRTQSFCSAAKQSGLTVDELIVPKTTMESGYNISKKICQSEPLPQGIFFGSDFLALGAIKAFLEHGIQIPEDISILSVGNGDPEQAAYSIISLSVIQIPMEEMARKCIQIVYRNLQTVKSDFQPLILQPKYIPGESCL